MPLSSSTNDLVAQLLGWFDRSRRALPWREEPRDPYRVWVSEVMLQQTRVDVVIPYFERFVRRFPTLAALAAAPLDDVLALWSGLGYYSRARNLHRAAQQAGRSLPRTRDELLELPGFGPYTAAAVASLAFQEDVPLVDGNVERVLSRLFRLTGRAAAWSKAAELLPAGRAGAFNEALMELGALVCDPRSPRCGQCPLVRQCAGKDEPGRFPARKQRAPRPRVEWRAVALRRPDGAVLLARRPAGELFAGLWDLPAPEAVARLAGPLSPAGEVRQALTHRDLRVAIFTGAARGRAPAGMRWVLPAGLGSLGVSSLAAKCLRRAGVTQASLRPARHPPG